MEFITAHPNNFKKGRDGKPLQYIIIHSIVGSIDSCIRTFQKPDRLASAHNIVGWTGREVQMVAYPDTAYHAGNWEINLRSIGIEHDDQARPYDPRPDIVYETSARRVAELCKAFNIPCNRNFIKKHSEVTLSSTACPAGLQIDRIVARAQQLLAPPPPPTPTPPPPAPAPPPKPEWEKNLIFLDPPYQRYIDKTVDLVNFETGQVIQTFAKGYDITVHYKTKVANVLYYMTGSSVLGKRPTGFLASDFEYMEPTTTTSSTSSTSTTSSSTTTPPPPVIIDPGSLDAFFKALVDLIKKILNWRIG